MSYPTFSSSSSESRSHYRASLNNLEAPDPELQPPKEIVSPSARRACVCMRLSVNVCTSVCLSLTPPPPWKLTFIPLRLTCHSVFSSLIPIGVRSILSPPTSLTDVWHGG
ncbi:hypothetical protein AAHC03_026284 [Spirometra sp. Aus1]